MSGEGPVMAGEGPVRHPISEDEIGRGVFSTPANIAWFRLETTIRYAEGRARGMHLVDPRKARSVQLKVLRETYGINARRWEQAEAELRRISKDWWDNGVPEGFLVRR